VSPIRSHTTTRHMQRDLVEELGVPCGPCPAGWRRIAVTVGKNGIVGDRDLSFGPGASFVESPAPGLADDLRLALHQAAALITETLAPGERLDCCFAVDGNEWLFTETDTEARSGQSLLGVAAVACRIRLRRTEGGKDDDPITALDCGESTNPLAKAGDTPAPRDIIAEVTVKGGSREQVFAELQKELAGFRCDGVPHDGANWLSLVTHPPAAWHPTHSVLPAAAGSWMTVLNAGLECTVQDLPGRLGLWEVGVPPSGPFDDRSFALANHAVGNGADAAGLEITLAGPTLRFEQDTVICGGGARMNSELDGEAVTWWKPTPVRAGQVLKMGGIASAGLRSYLAIRGGIDIAPYLGSRSTFTMARFGGHAGRALAVGDRLPLGNGDDLPKPSAIPAAKRPAIGKTWTLGVRLGPHAAPDYFTEAWIDTFFATEWVVSPQSNRSGIRLQGPKPDWARSDGGEAGLHPSNLHDNGYAIGAVDFTGDTPVILGPDGPSCGGFACPVVTVFSERWKLGQLRPGDTLRFERVDEQPAIARNTQATDSSPETCLRRAGDCYLLWEYGPMALNLALRLRVHRLHQFLLEQNITGVIDLVPGVRSVLVHHDPAVLSQERLAQLLVEADQAIASAAVAPVPSRTVHLPLSWDDPSTRKAIDIYMQTVNPDAPWCPWNIEFIRRINGLDSVDEVKRIVFDAQYLVVGLGDVYLGAPVATPVDPRHRLVTTKYNPARTWTPENAVGIGGAYMCIYGMEGPGGYQFVGRTVQIWNSWRERPWLLNQFDRIKWYEVDTTELDALRKAGTAGEWQPTIDEGYFDPAAHAKFLEDEAESIAATKARQQAAFNAERQRWKANKS
jgi:urea carboxylase